MSKRGKRTKKKRDELQPGELHAFQQHLRRLGIADEAEYRAWCEARGLPTALRKAPRQRRREFDLAAREIGDAGLEKLRMRSRGSVKMLDLIFDATEPIDGLTGEWQRIQELLGTLGRRPESKSAFRELILHTRKRTKLFSSHRVLPEYPANVHNCMLGALASLATHHRAWIRPLDGYKPSSKNARRQFGELARHLLAEYTVPAFMDSVWFRRTRTQSWFIHLGSGKNIRTAQRLMVPLTKKMAHAFSQAPSDYTVEHALRWAQINGLGGNRRVADGVRGTRLGRGFKNDDFWISVIRFFVNNPLLDTAHYGPIVDYIHHQKFHHERVFVRPGVVEDQPPPHPGFSMQRRSVDTLLRQVERWHRQLGHAGVTGDRAWDPSGLAEFEWVEGSEKSDTQKRWRIHELLSTNALFEEGRTMRHCVGSYAASCASGRTSIWTMRMDDGQQERRVLTIDVRACDRTIVEARGRFNAAPTEKSMMVLRRWAAREELSIPGYVAGGR